MKYEHIDWNKVWTNKMAHWRQASGKSCKECWADKKSATTYAAKHCAEHQDRVSRTLKELEIKSHSRVLDIGAGPGNLAIPIAKLVKFVTTVEPSKGMNSVMKTNMQEENVDNIITVEKTWEEVSLTSDLSPPYDLVIASMSLGMDDIEAAIIKMNQVCNGVITLFWHAGTPGWEAMPKEIWPKLFGKQYHGGPKSDVLFQVLYQMGIYPETSVSLNHFKETFPTLEAAEEYYCKRFNQITPEQRPVVKSYLKKHCSKTEDGYVHFF